MCSFGSSLMNVNAAQQWLIYSHLILRCTRCASVNITCIFPAPAVQFTSGGSCFWEELGIFAVLLPNSALHSHEIPSPDAQEYMQRTG